MGVEGTDMTSVNDEARRAAARELEEARRRAEQIRAAAAKAASRLAQTLADAAQSGGAR